MTQEDIDIRPAITKCTPEKGEGALPNDDVVILDTDMYNSDLELEIFDLYGVCSMRKNARSDPFVHGVILEGPKGENVRMRSVFDNGALVNALDLEVFHQIKDRLAVLQPSTRWLCMADGRIVSSTGVWQGMVSVTGACHQGAFEVFSSGGAWALLFGKPLLQELKAVHDYGSNKICMPTSDGWVTILNQYNNISNIGNGILVRYTGDIMQTPSSQNE